MSQSRGAAGGVYLDSLILPPQLRYTMTLAEQIFAEVRALPDTEAREVLDLVSFLKWKRQASQLSERQAALVGLARYRGRFKVGNFSRGELHDRSSLR